jgi:hypothetical protein
MVIGTVLPDFLKNAHKDWNVHPHKTPELFAKQEHLSAILLGWKRHLDVDLQFHTSSFFNDEMAILKNQLIPILSNSPVRPSFLAHIGVELILDHLLTINAKININKFYDQLGNVEDEALQLFLKYCGISNADPFFKFFNSFKSSRYLFSYQKLENISYALQRICMRLWAHPFDEATMNLLTQELEIYKEKLAFNYLAIFKEIEVKLIT